jgi:hypothetical protein
VDILDVRSANSPIFRLLCAETPGWNASALYTGTPPSPSPVKLVTSNVNWLKVRRPRVLESLAEHDPDIACMLETKTEDAAFPPAEPAAAGYHAVHHSAP